MYQHALLRLLWVVLYAIWCVWTESDLQFEFARHVDAHDKLLPAWPTPFYMQPIDSRL